MTETMEKYLTALAAAVEAKDKKAIELLDGFSSYIYQDIYARSENTPGEEQAAWIEKLERIKADCKDVKSQTPDLVGAMMVNQAQAVGRIIHH